MWAEKLNKLDDSTILQKGNRDLELAGHVATSISSYRLSKFTYENKWESKSMETSNDQKRMEESKQHEN